jgi:class 3 adenylate cyclase
LEPRCPSCGGIAAAGKRFCRACGALSGPLPGAELALPESYTPKHLAERILTSRSALEGERKHVTVLFADLKSSMEILADRDPEEARTLLDPVLERMMAAVHRYEGTVNLLLRDDDGKREEARALLAGVYGGFREGFETRDLRAARALLDDV